MQTGTEIDVINQTFSDSIRIHTQIRSGHGMRLKPSRWGIVANIIKYPGRQVEQGLKVGRSYNLKVIKF